MLDLVYNNSKPERTNLNINGGQSRFLQHRQQGLDWNWEMGEWSNSQYNPVAKRHIHSLHTISDHERWCRFSKQLSFCADETSVFWNGERVSIALRFRILEPPGVVAGKISFSVPNVRDMLRPIIELVFNDEIYNESIRSYWIKYGNDVWGSMKQIERKILSVTLNGGNEERGVLGCLHRLLGGIAQTNQWQIWEVHPKRAIDWIAWNRRGSAIRMKSARWSRYWDGKARNTAYSHTIAISAALRASEAPRLTERATCKLRQQSFK